ncbi:M20 family metallopeptidase [Alsobacter sp. SYSU M60028]|uniref:M20 family metallopeptidase n=1 Tax=Alsobacter ponti TaxID=2962936 RepID=A0ABT1LDN9_9HYPH|nr:M20 aminoacylase family protein [Alsobacter ponti]MCP8938840.1 M20 family metallopeptidase [Alsobacter ponti]
MAVINRIAAFADEIADWRRDLHAHPELDYDVHRTAGVVAEKLKAFGCDEVVTGIGRTGVVGVIKGSLPGDRVIGLRADMDALPIQEITGKPYASRNAGRMHACGHDGHTAMLLGAARYLAETRNFAGTAVVIFQPAEEGGGGGKAMVDDGLMDRFGVQEVYGMHNAPGLPVGEFALRPGPMLAAADRFTIQIEAKGGHAAYPHQAIDAVVIGSQMVTALQSVVARNVDPLESAVLSITWFHAGDAFNVLPQSATLKGTVRTFKPAVQDLVEQRLKDVATAVAAMHGATATVEYNRGYPCTSNHLRQTEFAASVAKEVAGEDKVDTDYAPVMGAEDFSYMLLARPGAFIFIGNGDTASVHHPAYDFEDRAIPHGVSYWARLVEASMPAA